MLWSQPLLLTYIQDNIGESYKCLVLDLTHEYIVGMLTQEGRCKTLDASADGYVRAETCIVVLMDVANSLEHTHSGSPEVFLKGSFVNQVLKLKKITFCMYLQ